MFTRYLLLRFEFLLRARVMSCFVRVNILLISDEVNMLLVMILMLLTEVVSVFNEHRLFGDVCARCNL